MHRPIANNEACSSGQGTLQCHCAGSESEVLAAGWAKCGHCATYCEESDSLDLCKMDSWVGHAAPGCFVVVTNNACCHWYNSCMESQVYVTSVCMWRAAKKTFL
jgi:hypothetical protein